MTGSAQLLLGLMLGVTMALGGYWKGALTRSGAISAAPVGAIVFGLGGWAWGILLVAFFVASSALSFHNPRRKKIIAAEKFEKSNQRDWSQVLANGGWATLLALLMWWQPAHWLFLAFVGTIATVTADTWATELGTLSKHPPRLLSTWQVVPHGTSGGITLLGTIAAISGALFIGTLAYTTAGFGGAPLLLINPLWLPLIAAISGLMGALMDSLLGATVQRIYYCARCKTETERPLHRCGTATHPIRGWQWMDNDMVNFLSSVTGSAVAIWLSLAFL